MNVISHLEPDSVFTYFEKICSIPHGSGNTKALSDYCVEFAKEKGLWYLRDDLGNVIIKKPASAGYENRKAVILQGHLDMVLDQVEGNPLNLSKDGLVLGIDGDWVHANGTTLGGDNGIAVAYMLALLDGDYTHPALECVFTIDEETGLIGAGALDTSCLEGAYMINLDSEADGIFTVGCAGGSTVEISLPVKRKDETGLLYEVSVEDLSGGHSGGEIINERGNANKYMARFLLKLDERICFSLVSLEGGTVENAIPFQAKAGILIRSEDEAILLETVDAFGEILKHELRTSDPDAKIAARIKECKTVSALDPKSFARILFLLNMLPTGVEKRSLEIENLVQTSSNLGVVRLMEDELFIGHSVRSSVVSEKEALRDRICLCADFLGADSEIRGDYSGWEYRKDSDLERTFVAVYERMYQKKPQVIAIHAGLECGLFVNKMPNLQCISMGPDMRDIHSSQEWLSISSTKRVWEFLLEVLKELK